MSKLIWKIALRNLVRQKRRNLLLGIGIAVGMMLLVMANAFTAGISDTLFNRLIVNIVGHMSVAPTERGTRRQPIVRDRPRFEELIMKNVEGVREIRESVAVFCRVIGNTGSESAVLVARADTAAAWEGLIVTGGNLADMTNGRLPFPIMVYEDRARELGLKLYDTLNARFQTITGQAQTARFTVAVLARAASSFDSFPMFTGMADLKQLLGYGVQEARQLQIILARPRTAPQQADRLHAALAPQALVAYGNAAAGGRTAPAVLAGFLTNGEALALLGTNLRFIAGSPQAAFAAGTALVSEELATRLALAPGRGFFTSWKKKFADEPGRLELTVAGIFRSPAGAFAGPAVLVAAPQWSSVIFPALPANLVADAPAGFSLGSLAPAIVPEWELLPRTATTEAAQAKQRALATGRWYGTRLDVQTMYETASAVLGLENALTLITFVAVLVLFFIILIGVVNTLRMTIRERTREIGTIRAIGMQRREVRNTFLAESFFLSLFASLAGVVLGLVAMGLLSLVYIDTQSALGVLLDGGYLHFVPTPADIVVAVVLIILITMATAWFPARRASRLSAAAALRHYE